METSDKAVSTEDLGVEITRNASLDVARLEAVLSTLVGNKVEAIKHHEKRHSSANSSPKSIIHKLRMASTSTVSSKDKEEPCSENSKRKIGTGVKQTRKNTGAQKRKEAPSDSPKAKADTRASNDRTPPLGDEDSVKIHSIDISSEKPYTREKPCCCQKDNGQIRIHYDSDYISLKIDEYDEDLDDEILAQEALRRARRKRRRKRKRKMKRQMALSNMRLPHVDEEALKVIDPDELPQRARWTIVATACLLLFMCLLLVGITLRMAPLIDEMVRAENEMLMNTLSRDQSAEGENKKEPFVPAPTIT